MPCTVRLRLTHTPAAAPIAEIAMVFAAQTKVACCLAILYFLHLQVFVRPLRIVRGRVTLIQESGAHSLGLLRTDPGRRLTGCLGWTTSR